MLLVMHETSYGSPVIHGNQSSVHVGKFCSIDNTAIFDCGFQHNTRFATTYPLWRFGASENKKGMSRGDIHIGNDVWIGHEAMIMSGVTIGDGAIVAARAVVNKDVQPYTLVGGLPAHLIEYRFSYEARQALMRIKWWDWPMEKIMENAPLLLSEDLGPLLEKYG